MCVYSVFYSIFYTTDEGDIPSIQCKMSLRRDKSINKTMKLQIFWARTTQRTPFPRIFPLLSDVLRGLLPRVSPGIVDDGACFGCRGKLFNGRCLTTDDFFKNIRDICRHVKM
jgi:hypothetical protein